MCGFVGCMYNTPQIVNKEMKHKLSEMNNIITHRGPDSEGYYFDDYINFGFRRLSIIDLESGSQPLSFENERYWIIFNGEIYNYIELRQKLMNMGFTFSTESDTEVIIALYSHLKEKAVQELRGMFAFIIWDKIEQTAFAARDHFGIKPFFYSEHGETTYFASEKKSILLAMNGKLDRDSLQHYLSFQYVPEPDTITNEIKKLPPGYYLIKKPGRKVSIRSYWKPLFQPMKLSKDELTTEIRDVLFDSVKVHMRSDVPVGSFLSGGIDSSLIVSLAKQFNPRLKTFSVGFERDGFSEVDVAQETASALGLENISYIVSADEFIKELPKIVWHMDDPLADPAAVPLFFVAREASKHVKVVLSGEGADELFGGYNIYREPHSLQMFNYIPKPIKFTLKTISRMLPDGVKGKGFIERGITPLEDRYIGNAKMFEEHEKKLLLTQYKTNLNYKKVTSDIYNQSLGYDAVSKMQHLDIHTWLRGDILLKADKMTMAHSLELRVPFLDKEVFDVASKIHDKQKIKNNTTKYILRKAAEGIVPAHVLHRKKLGFPVPIRHWLKDEIYDWANDLIQTSPTDYLLKKQEVLNLLEQHVTNKKDNSRKIWTLLVFMIWHQVFVEHIYEFDSTPLMKTNKQGLLIS
jgi:asparagine synthase (glutamine-hydrolysing)